MTERAAQTGGDDFSSASMEFLRDPHAILARIRPSVRAQRDALGDSFLLTHHADANDLLRDPRHSKDPRKLTADHPLRRVHAGRSSDRPPSLVFLDPPEHGRLRRLVSPLFTPRAVDQRRHRIQEIVDLLVRGLADRETFDLIKEIAQPLPILVIGELLGISTEDHVRFTRWSLDLVHSLNPLAPKEDLRRAEQADRSLVAHLAEVLRERRARPEDDLVSALASSEEDGAHLTDGELIDLCILILVAGNVTTTDLIGNGMLSLLRHPDQHQKLCKNPSLITAAVEEMLRYDPAVTSARRFITQDTEIAGCPMRKGTYVGASIASANRDPEVFAEPDTFDITRSPNPHLTFGAGIHYCLGAALARAEAQIAVSSLLERYPTLRLAVPVETLCWKRVAFFRGLAALPVRVD